MCPSVRSWSRILLDPSGLYFFVHIYDCLLKDLSWLRWFTIFEKRILSSVLCRHGLLTPRSLDFRQSAKNKPYLVLYRTHFGLWYGSKSDIHTKVCSHFEPEHLQINSIPDMLWWTLSLARYKMNKCQNVLASSPSCLWGRRGGKFGLIFLFVSLFLQLGEPRTLRYNTSTLFYAS